MVKHPIRELLDDDWGEFGGGSGESILAAVARRAGKRGSNKQLIAILLANPKDEFGKNEIFGLFEYWHHRSADDLLFVLPGYKITSDSSVEKPPEFSPEEFNAFLNWLSEETTVRYRSLALLLLVVGNRRSEHAEWELDWTHVFIIQLERLVQQQLVESAKTLFEDVIALAKLNPKAPDDTLVQLAQTLDADVMETNLAKGIASFFTFLVPAEARKSAVVIAQAKSNFKMSDVKKYK